MVREKVKYRQTGIEWIPTIPSHWEMRRIKNIFTFKKEIVGDGSADFKVLSLTVHGDGIIERDIESGMGKFPSTFDGYQKIEPNNIVLCLFDMDVTPRIVGFSELTGIISAAYTNIVSKEKVCPKYYYYYFLNQDRDKSLYALGKGIRITLREDSFGSLFAPYPPYEEQKAIAEYLDSQIEKINLFIQKKLRLIELLKEQRQSVIHQVVTKGLHKEIEFKFSGIEWLGYIPTHWEIRRLKECLIGKLKYGANESGEEFNPFWYRYIRITDFSLDGKLSEENKLSLSPEVGAEYELQEGDILFARSGATVGKTYQFHYVSEEEKYCYAGYLIKATPDENIILSDFLLNYTNSKAFENWKNLIFNKATIENIGADKYSVLKVPIPPLNEQKQIVKHIKTETTTIDTAIAKAEREIELVREYKEAMISEAVMGKRK